jgi:hypothetical protein
VIELLLVFTIFLIFENAIVVLCLNPKASVMIFIFLFFNLHVLTPFPSVSSVYTLNAAWAREKDFLLLNLLLLFATSTDAWGTFEQETTVLAGDILPTSEDLLFFSSFCVSDPMLEVDEEWELWREGEEEEEEEEEMEEVEVDAIDAEASLAAFALSWYILARHGLMVFPETAKKMEDNLEARLR